MEGTVWAGEDELVGGTVWALEIRPIAKTPQRPVPRLNNARDRDRENWEEIDFIGICPDKLSLKQKYKLGHLR
ncbi:hypothetical protein OLK001_04660 [Synechocystis sp. LKSZ1]